MHKRVEEGMSLSEAMRANPEAFDPVCRSLVAAGETSGQMTKMLDRLANLCRKQLHLRNAIVGAMVYPIVLIFIAIAVLNLMLLFVLPRFAGLFKNARYAAAADHQDADGDERLSARSLVCRDRCRRWCRVYRRDVLVEESRRPIARRNRAAERSQDRQTDPQLDDRLGFARPAAGHLARKSLRAAADGFAATDARSGGALRIT